MEEQEVQVRVANKPKRNWSVLAMTSKPEFAALNTAAKAHGYSRSSLAYALLYKATKGFTDFDVSDVEGVLDLRPRRDNDDFLNDGSE